MQSEREFLQILLARPQLIDETSVLPKHFGDGRLKQIFAAMTSLDDSGVIPDMVTISDFDGGIDPILLSELSSNMGPGNLKYHAGRILADYNARYLKGIANETLDRITNGDDPGEVREWIESAVLGHTEDELAGGIYRLGELLPEAIKDLEDRYNRKDFPGYRIGIDGVDRVILGLQPRRYYLIGGRPSDGKSALILNSAIHLTMVSQVPAGIISLESGGKELLFRTIAQTAKVNSQKMAGGLITQADIASIFDWGDALSRAPLYIYDEPRTSINRIRSVARAMVRRYGVKALFIDYLQYIDTEKSRGDNRHEHIASISRSLKALSRELSIPVVAAAQLRRDAQNRRPTLADFSDSSQIEKDADAAILIQRDPDTEHEGSPVRWLHVDKNRDGRTATVKTRFHRSFVKFVEALD